MCSDSLPCTIITLSTGYHGHNPYNFIFYIKASNNLIIFHVFLVQVVLFFVFQICCILSSINMYYLFLLISTCMLPFESVIFLSSPWFDLHISLSMCLSSPEQISSSSFISLTHSKAKYNWIWQQKKSINK